MYKLKQILTGATFALITGLATMSGNAIASTPDGETPANEGVCDTLQGGSPGLYGLCVAYCEAQDLDLVGDKETPNNKILANYRKKMKDGDPDMPCIQVPCPCYTEAELATIGGSGGSLSCTTSSTSAVFRSSNPTIFATIDTTRPLCRYTDTTTTPRTSLRFSGDDAFPAGSAESCLSMIVESCAGFGL